MSTQHSATAPTAFYSTDKAQVRGHAGSTLDARQSAGKVSEHHVHGSKAHPGICHTCTDVSMPSPHWKHTAPGIPAHVPIKAFRHRLALGSSAGDTPRLHMSRDAGTARNICDGRKQGSRVVHSVRVCTPWHRAHSWYRLAASRQRNKNTTDTTSDFLMSRCIAPPVAPPLSTPCALAG